MAYADQRMSQGRIAAIVFVAILHAFLGYAFITGLAYNVVKQVAADLKTFDVEDEAPPPEEPPPPPEKVEIQPPPVVAPPPIVRTNVAPPPVQIVREAPPPVITPTAVPAPPAPPAPPPPKPRAAERAKPRGAPGSWVTNDDYPSSAQRAGESGVTSFKLDIGTDGRATNCSVTGSSGSAALDSTACKLLMRRARFTPAKDTQGNPVTDSYSNRVRWELPD